MRQEWLEVFHGISWSSPLALAVASGAVGSVITLSWISVKEAGDRRRLRRDTALELALALESYARTCRTMMHKAAWAAAESVRHSSGDAAESVSVAGFAYPDKVQWGVLSRKVVPELREYPATVHAARGYVEALREFGDPVDLCDQVEYECAKAAKAALVLARATRRRHGAATWKPGAKDSSFERELVDFIANAEEKRKASLRERTPSVASARVERQPLDQPLSA